MANIPEVGNEAHGKGLDRRLSSLDDVYYRDESSGFDRPHSEYAWSYRVLKLERAVAWAYLFSTNGSQEDEIKRLALSYCHFGADIDYPEVTIPIEAVWSEATKYPDPAYKHMRDSPEGQCGVTDFGFANLLGSTNLVPRKNIFFCQGELYAADGTLLDPDHTWAHIIGDNGREWRMDFTSHQSAERNPDPNGFMRIVMQPVDPDLYDVMPHPLINQPPLSEDEYRNYRYPAKNASAIVFKEKTRTPIEEFDIGSFKGRYEKFCERLGLTALGRYLGEPGSRYAFDLSESGGLWYPDTYNFKAEGSDITHESDSIIREKMYDYRPKLASDYNLSDADIKVMAEWDAKEGVGFAIRANRAHTAVQRGELVVTDDNPRSRHHDAKETFEALQLASGSLIGRGTLGSYALQFLREEH